MEFEVEHIVPVARGGADALDNLALCCRSCNAHKADATEGHDHQTGQVVRLFHPRHDDWDTHFLLDQRAAMIVGKTAIGRVTVDHLGMNRAAAVRARQIWLAHLLW